MSGLCDKNQSYKNKVGSKYANLDINSTTSCWVNENTLIAYKVIGESD